MPTCSQTHDPTEDRIAAVSVYGLTRKESVGRLVMALAAIPCFPSAIFKVDRYGKLLVVTDHVGEDRVFYVRVRHWGRHPDRLPEIEWTSVPSKFGVNLRKRAASKVLDYTSGVRTQPMVVKYSVKKHCELSAIMVLNAS